MKKAIIKKNNKYVLKEIKYVGDERCELCGSRAEHLHHIFYGRADRKKSDKYNLIIPLCQRCHWEVHYEHNIGTGNMGKQKNEYLKKLGYQFFIENIGTRQEFYNIFKKLYD
jgi:hypothetical protein